MGWGVQFEVGAVGCEGSEVVVVVDEGEEVEGGPRLVRLPPRPAGVRFDVHQTVGNFRTDQ